MRISIFFVLLVALLGGPLTAVHAQMVAPAPVFLSKQEVGQFLDAENKLAGVKMFGPAKVLLGEVQGVLTTADKKEVVGYVLSIGGFLGVDAKLVGVPVSAAYIWTGPSGSVEFHMGLFKIQLVDAPTFKRLE